MAKRYGRNQRRRHREEIAAQADRIANLEGAYEREQALLSHLGAELRELKASIIDWDDDVRRMLGEYSAFRLRTARVKTNGPVSRVPLPTSVTPWSGVEEISKKATYAMADLRRFVVSAGKDPIGLREIVRLIVERPMGGEELHFCYAIDGSQLLLCGRRDAAFLAKEVSRVLIERLEGVV